ncbi:MAG TPA: DUF3618 domain-containing protein [Phototrophicaceae bacterium]|nr:DUF3618 domain-containing protein [Phototrophicaceae bacterium]
MSGKRTPEEIEADLARTRQELASSVDELSTMLDPRVQLKEAKENISTAAKHAVDGAGAKAQAFLEDVKSGDPKAIGLVGAGAAAVAAVIALAARRSG